MIIGTHALLYSKDADKDRAFFKEVLNFKAADAGDNWLIFKLPPAELGVHPTEDEPSAELYLMCDDVNQTIADLKAKGISCTDVYDAGWGLLTRITLPSGGELGIYQPRHAMAIDL